MNLSRSEIIFETDESCQCIPVLKFVSNVPLSWPDIICFIATFAKVIALLYTQIHNDAGEEERQI